MARKSTKIERPKSSEDALELLRKTYGKNSFAKGSEIDTRVDFIETSFFQLNMALSGGIPRGRIGVVWGAKSSGKTVLSLDTIANAQKTCRICGLKLDKCQCKNQIPMKCVFFDMERTFSPSFAELWGVNTEDLIVFEPEYSEQMLDSVSLLVSSKDIDLVVIDSIAQTIAKLDMESSCEDNTVALDTKLLGKGLKKWNATYHNIKTSSKDAKTSILLLNQARANLAPYGGKVKMFGGYNLGHTNTFVVKLAKIEDFMYSDFLTMGQKTKFLIEKNKQGVARRAGEFDLYFVNDPTGKYKAGTTDTVNQILTYAANWGLVSVARKVYSFLGNEIHEKDLPSFFAAKPEELERIKQRVLEQEELFRQGILIPKEGMVMEEDDLDKDVAPINDLEFLSDDDM